MTMHPRLPGLSVAIMLVLTATLAAADAPTTQPSFDDVLSELSDYGILLNSDLIGKITLDDKQSIAVHAAMDALADDRAKYRTQHLLSFIAITRIQNEIKAAHGQADPLIVREKFRQYEDFFRGNLTLMRRAYGAILVDLTQKQRVQWEALGLDTRFHAMGLDRAKLSAQQQDNFDTIIDAAGAKIIELGDQRSSDAVSKIRDAAAKECKKSLLTPQQRKDFGFFWMTDGDLGDLFQKAK